MKTGLKTILIAVSIALISVNTASAESSKEYAIMGKKTWEAFGCSILAGKSKNPKEQERLFLFGYYQGLQFITALQKRQIKRKDLSAVVPLAVKFSLAGPTPDFMLGRIFEVAMKDTLKEGIYEPDGKFYDEEIQKTNAEKKFSERNCQLIDR